MVAPARQPARAPFRKSFSPRALSMAHLEAVNTPPTVAVKNKEAKRNH